MSFKLDIIFLERGH